MSVATIITDGYGSFGTIARVITFGYFIGAPPIIIDAPQYIYTIMRASDTNTDVDALIAIAYSQGGTITATKYSAAIMTNSAENTSATISSAALNTSAELI